MAAELERLRALNQNLQGDLSQAAAQQEEFKRREEEKDWQLQALKESSQANKNLNDTTSLGALRAEILARCGAGEGPLAGAMAPVSGPLGTGPFGTGHPLNSALRRIGEGSPIAQGPLGSMVGPAFGNVPESSASLQDDRLGLGLDSSRKTIANQREMFERLKQQFSEAQGSTLETPSTQEQLRSEEAV